MTGERSKMRKVQVGTSACQATLTLGAGYDKFA
jgi:hypothetical protein